MTQLSILEKEIEKGYEEVSFVPRPLQSRELNVLQTMLNEKISRLASSLFAEGSILQGSIRRESGKFVLRGCVAYLGGSAYKLVDQDIPFSLEQDILLGKIESRVVDHKEDKDLEEQEPGTNKGNPGANRIQKIITLKVSPKTEPGFVPLGGGNSIRDSAFDEVIHTDDLRAGLRSIKDGSRVLVKGGVFRVEEPLIVSGSNIFLEFHPSVRLLGTETTPKEYFLDVKGTNVSISGLVFGWDAPRKIKTKVRATNEKNHESPHFSRCLFFGDNIDYATRTDHVQKKTIEEYKK